MKHTIKEPKQYSFIQNLEKSNNNNAQCQHDWSFYTGFSEAYWFCTKCDKKQKSNQKFTNKGDKI